MSLYSTTKTVSDVATYVKRQFGDESGVQITDADILRWVNEAQREIVVRNRMLKAKAQHDVVAGQSDYTFPSQNIYQIESLHYKGVPLKNINYAEAENFIINGGENDGRPILWYEWAGVITLWPTPQESITDGLSLLYTLEPPVLTSMGDTLSVPDKYFGPLLRYSLGQAYEQDEEFEAAVLKMQQFDSSLDVLFEEERTAQSMVYPVITVVD